MKVMRADKIRYLATMAGVIFLILVIFNTIFTFLVHKKLSDVVSNPGRWPAGAYIYDEHIGFDFASDVSGPIGDGSFYVKSHQYGYRIGEREDAGSWQPGGILSLGCSFTYGDEVVSGLTFTQQAATALGLPAYNYGICSFSYTHALLKARELKEQGILDRLQPRFVLLGCWNGLPDRSRSPFPPLASNSLPLPSAYMTEEGGKVTIQYPMKLAHVFEMVELYRKEGPGMNVKKFFRIFFVAPKYVYLYLKNNRLSQKMKFGAFNNNVPDRDVYDYYFSGVEDVFSAYGSRIIVLFMPNNNNEKPGSGLIEALSEHPGITFVDGGNAIEKYGIDSRDFVRRHPQPRAHLAYARELVERILAQ